MAAASKPAAVPRWDLIAYMIRFAGPQLQGNYKTEAEQLLPYLALGLLRHEDYAWVNPLLPAPEEQPQAAVAVVLDVGAYDGAFTSEVVRTMSHPEWRRWRRRKRRLRVVAAEPSPASYAELRARGRLEGWNRSVCSLQLAFSSAPSWPGERQFLVGWRQAARLAKPEEVDPAAWQRRSEGGAGAWLGKPAEVKVVTIDGLFAQHRCGLRPRQQVYLLKVDTEGHDGRVLYGAERLIAESRVKYILFEQIAEGGAEDLLSVSHWLWQNGYGCFLVLDHILVPVSASWYHPAYRDTRFAGLVRNVDLLCARPQDPDLPAVVEAFVTHRHATRAKEIALLALADWRRALESRSPSATTGYSVGTVSVPAHNSIAGLSYFYGDMLSKAPAAAGRRATEAELRRARAWFRLGASVKDEAACNLVGAFCYSTSAGLELAHCYHFGECARRDLELALHWYRRFPSSLMAAMMHGLVVLERNGTSVAEIANWPQW